MVKNVPSFPDKVVEFCFVLHLVGSPEIYCQSKGELQLMDMKRTQEASVTEKSNDGWERDGCSVGWLASNWMRGRGLPPKHF